MITAQDRNNISRIFRKIADEIRPALAKRRREESGQPQSTDNVMVAQNAIRVCMEVVFNECLPYDDLFCAELAIRLAAYAISAIPIERQQVALAAVIAGLPNGLATKLRAGAIIKTTWVTDGVVHPNVPERGEVQ